MKDRILDIVIIIFLAIVAISLWVFAGISFRESQRGEPVQIPYFREEMPMIQGNALIGNTPPAEIKSVPLGVRVVTAYSSEEEQTDGTPFITASNQQVREGIAASNELPLGTIIEIDGRIYEIQDRMHQRYADRIDLWMANKDEAVKFGKQLKEVKLIR